MIQHRVVVKEELLQRLLVIRRQRGCQERVHQFLLDGLFGGGRIGGEVIAGGRQNAGQAIAQIDPRHLHKLRRAGGIVQRLAQRLVEVTRHGREAAVNLGHLVAHILQLALDVIQR